MPAYYFLHEPAFFHQVFVPALTACWRDRCFDPCRSLCKSLLPAVDAFAARGWSIPEKPLVCLAADGLNFDRHFWTQLVGEILLYGAAEIPELQSDLLTLRELVEPHNPRADSLTRDCFLPIDQAHFGSRDLTFGSKIYRPEHAGYNDVEDVIRLQAYLDGIDPARWDHANLSERVSDPEDVADLLAFAEQSLSSLRDTYRLARSQGCLIIHETL
jgi:hypothetical protein